MEVGDVEGLRRAWAKVGPKMPQPATYEQAEIIMHYARTQARWLNLKGRAYSHAWLRERLLPSGLPDELKPRAERLCPVIAEAVGISVNFGGGYLKPAEKE